MPSICLLLIYLIANPSTAPRFKADPVSGRSGSISYLMLYVMIVKLYFCDAENSH